VPYCDSLIDDDHHLENGRNWGSGNIPGKARSSIKYRGLVLSTSSSSASNSNIFLWNSPSWQRDQVFQIQEILQDGVTDFTLSVKKYRPATLRTDVYAKYDLLRAKTWSRELDPQVVTIKVSAVRCHGLIWNFSDEHCVAVILDRVRTPRTTDKSVLTWHYLSRRLGSNMPLVRHDTFRTLFSEFSLLRIS
jgi:hypothetical protein